MVPLHRPGRILGGVHAIASERTLPNSFIVEEAVEMACFVLHTQEQLVRAAGEMSPWTSRNFLRELSLVRRQHPAAVSEYAHEMSSGF